MRKSFKKGIAILTAAALALGTPIAYSAVSDAPVAEAEEAATGAEKLTGAGWWDGTVERSSYYKNNAMYFKPAESNKGFAVDLTLDDKSWITFDSNRGEKTYDGSCTITKGEATLDANHVYEVSLKKDTGKVAVSLDDLTSDTNFLSFDITVQAYVDAQEIWMRLVATDGTYYVSDNKELVEAATFEPEATATPEPTDPPEKVTLPKAIYENNFETDNYTKGRISGSGSFVSEKEQTYGTVFQNKGGKKGTNFFLLPDNVFSANATAIKNGGLTISFAVNANGTDMSGTTTGSYRFAPLFTAHATAPNSAGENAAPVIAVQTRLRVNVNNGHDDLWQDVDCPADLVDMDAEGKTDQNYGDVDWLNDAAWHVYTLTMSEDKTVVYIDAVKVQEVTSNNSIKELLSGDIAKLKYIALGGNQAFNWADNDAPFKFDDVAIYAKALNASEVNKVVYNSQNVIDTGDTTGVAPIPTAEPTPVPSESKMVANFKFTGEIADGKYTESGATFNVKGEPQIVDNPDAAGDKVLAINEDVDGSTQGDKYDALSTEIGVLSGCDFSSGMTISMNVKPVNNASDWNYTYGIGKFLGGDGVDAFVDGTIGLIARSAPTYTALFPNDGWVDGNTVDSKYDFFTKAGAGNNKWANITIVYGTEKTAIYVDGVKSNEWTSAPGIVSAMTDCASGRLNIGCGIDPALEHFAGYMDDFKVYQGALTADEVAAVAADPGTDEGESPDLSGTPGEPTQAPTEPTKAPEASQEPAGPTQAPDASQTPDDGKDVTTTDDDNNTTSKKKTLKISAVKAKAGTKKVTGKVSAKNATVKVKVGKKAYKKASVSGKKFTLKCAKLKKGTKVKIKATKKNYKNATKSVKVKK